MRTLNYAHGLFSRLVVGVLLLMFVSAGACQEKDRPKDQLKKIADIKGRMVAADKLINSNDFEQALEVQSKATLAAESLTDEVVAGRYMHMASRKKEAILRALGRFADAAKVGQNLRQRDLENSHLTEVERRHRVRYHDYSLRCNDDLRRLPPTEKQIFINAQKRYLKIYPRLWTDKALYESLEKILADMAAAAGDKNLFVNLVKYNVGYWIFHHSGDFDRGAVCFKETLDVFTEVLGSEYPKTIECKFNLGRTFWRDGNLFDAEKWIRQTADDSRKANRLKTAKCGYFQFVAGLIQAENGSPYAARVYLDRSLVAYENSTGVDSQEYARSVTELSNLTSLLSDRHQALKFSLHANQIFESVKPTPFNLEHGAWAKLNLARCYSELGDFQKTLNVLDEFQVVADQLGLATKDFAATERYSRCLLLRAKTLNKLDRIEEADDVVHRAIKMYTTVTKTDNIRYGHAIVQYQLVLAEIESKKGEKEKAISILRKAMVQAKKSARGEYKIEALIAKTIGSNLAELGRTSEAREAFVRSLELNYRDLQNQTLSLTAHELATVNNFSRESLSLLAQHSRLDNHRDVLQLYQQVWRFEGLTSRIIQARINSIETNDSHSNPEKFARYVSARQDLSKALLAGAVRTKQEKQTEHLLDLEIRLRRAIGELVGHVKCSTVMQTRKLSELGSVLDEDTALVDIISVDSERQEPGDDYLAFVITLDQDGQLEIQARVVGLATEIDHYIAAFSQGVSSGKSRGLRPTKKKISAAGARKRLAAKVWAPIQAELGSRKKLIICPEGGFTQLSWSALPNKDGGYLIQNGYHFIQGINGQSVLDAYFNNSIDIESALLIGNLDYGLEPNDSLHLRWSQLKETEAEIDSIGNTLPSNTTVISISGEKATESKVLREMAKANIVHFATHGFEIRDLTAMTQSESDSTHITTLNEVVSRHPFVPFGVVLSSANRHVANLVGSSKAVDLNEDCFLTGEDILRKDLKHVDLFVLSACHSGKGQVLDAEGVLGLQHAIHLAGARSTIASIWDVDDRATRLLMTEFYRNYVTLKLSKSESLRRAQLSLLKRPDIHPADWAAWTVTGDWR